MQRRVTCKIEDKEGYALSFAYLMLYRYPQLHGSNNRKQHLSGLLHSISALHAGGFMGL